MNRHRLLWILAGIALTILGLQFVTVASAASTVITKQDDALDTTDSKVSSVEGAQLSVMPTSCVALHRGQLCYQRIRLSWFSSDGKRYCLFADDSDVLLYCSSSSHTVYLHEYSSKSSESYSLRLGDEGPIVSSVNVSTSWVYRTGRRSSSGWRLF